MSVIQPRNLEPGLADWRHAVTSFVLQTSWLKRRPIFYLSQSVTMVSLFLLWHARFSKPSAAKPGRHEPDLVETPSDPEPTKLITLLEELGTVRSGNHVGVSWAYLQLRSSSSRSVLCRPSDDDHHQPNHPITCICIMPSPDVVEGGIVSSSVDEPDRNSPVDS